MRDISFSLNGKPTRLTVDPERMLLWVLRDDLGLTGNEVRLRPGAVRRLHRAGEQPGRSRSCSTTVGEVAGKQVVTIEGLAKDGACTRCSRRSSRTTRFQCGYCTPGMILGAYALLLKKPTAHARRDRPTAWTTHLCRCGAHVRIVRGHRERRGAGEGGCAMNERRRQRPRDRGRGPDGVPAPIDRRDFLRPARPACFVLFFVDRLCALPGAGAAPDRAAGLPLRLQRLPAHRRRRPGDLPRRQDRDGPGRDRPRCPAARRGAGRPARPRWTWSWATPTCAPGTWARSVR